jgi:hypothetical protein
MGAEPEPIRISYGSRSQQAIESEELEVFAGVGFEPVNLWVMSPKTISNFNNSQGAGGPRKNLVSDIKRPLLDSQTNSTPAMK